MGHKGPVLRPRCTRPERARTQIPFNSIQIHAHTKQQATHSTKNMETGYCCRCIWWCIWGPWRKISQQTTPFSKSVCKPMPSGEAWCRCFKNLLMPSYGQAILLTQVADADYRNWLFIWFSSIPPDKLRDSTSHSDTNTSFYILSHLLFIFTYSIYRGLIKCIKYIKRPTHALWFCASNFIAQWSPTCFGHSRGHRQGGKNKNTNINVSKSCISLQIISFLVEIHCWITK